jgi:peroxiredoxin
MPLDPGTRAPAFELTLIPGEAPLRLDDYKGIRPVVLLFFPLAFSSVCTKEMEWIAQEYERWHALEAEVIGISVDSAFVNRRFAAELEAPFPIVSDFNKEATTAYDVRNDDYFGMKGVSNRSAFVIDREGVIVYSWMSEDSSVLPPFDDIAIAVRDSA